MSTLKITLKRGMAGCTAKQRDTVASLGLRKIRDSVERPDTPIVRGAIQKVEHLVEVEEVGS